MKDKVAKAFTGIADFYDEYMEKTGHVAAQLKILDQIVPYVEPPVLNLATGTGLFAAGLMAVGLDVSKQMIYRAKQKYGWTPLIVGDSKCLPFKDKAFNTVVSCLAFLWFPDPEKVLKEMVRVAEKVYIVEEEGTPARKRVEIPAHLKAFFEEVERLETPISIAELDEKYVRVAEADIDGSHKFVCWEVNACL